MKPRRLPLLLLVFGFVLGVAIWVLSPWLFGTAEPWDATAPIWPFSWLVVAILGGMAGHVRGVFIPIGYALGQILVKLPSVLSSKFGPLGWLFIGAYAAVAVLLTLAIIGVVVLTKRAWRARTSRVDSV